MNVYFGHQGACQNVHGNLNITEGNRWSNCANPQKLMLSLQQIKATIVISYMVPVFIVKNEHKLTSDF